jgi:thioredoxin reductase (NADPH)
MNAKKEIFDAIVVGAGPGGLTAATYLGRFRRQCLVLEDGHSRARWIPTSHNIPGFTAGIGGPELLAKLKEQSTKYGAQIRSAHVAAVTMDESLFVVAPEAQESLYSRYLLLATGVKDHLPALPGVSEAVLRSVLRFCPICDAFEAIDRRIAVIGNGPAGEREAEFLTTYSKHVTLLHLGGSESAWRARKYKARGIEWIPIELSDLRIEEDHLTLRARTAEERRFDVAYLALGCSAQHRLAKDLGAACECQGALIVNAHQETSVPRLYTAGDLVRGLNQVIVAAAEGAIAATDIHNKLRGA